LHDELPAVEGIYQYEKGNYEDLRRALERALGGYRQVDRKLLRASTSPHDVDNWCEATRAAFQEFLAGRQLRA
jgi:hypothetical protein